MKRTGHAEDLYTLRLSITRQREFQACAWDIVPVGKDAGGRCGVAVGAGGSGPFGRATPPLTEPTVLTQAVPCRDARYEALAALFLGGRDSTGMSPTGQFQG